MALAPGLSVHPDVSIFCLLLGQLQRQVVALQIPGVFVTTRSGVIVTVLIDVELWPGLTWLIAAFVGVREGGGPCSVVFIYTILMEIVKSK